MGILSACSYQPEISYNDGKSDPLTNLVKTLRPSSQSKDSNKSSQTDNLIMAQQVLDASVEEIPTLTAVGYAVVSTQPGRSDAQKRLMAIRAARMAAMRDLAEQIHGLQKRNKNERNTAGKDKEGKKKKKKKKTRGKKRKKKKKKKKKKK